MGFFVKLSLQPVMVLVRVLVMRSAVTRQHNRMQDLRTTATYSQIIRSAAVNIS
jgi:hypothetical protein